ncbi:hypothetical protein [Halorientalis salina]|uniref:hypothetical protein n=1 Tax=Halorientalis salina TaxID=2932266 RepID=UPI0010AB9E58|nr:hypothetical protein [Halorientalis salina]
MFRRTLLLVLVVSVAGCLDGGTGGSPTASATELTPSESPTSTPTDTPDVTTAYGTDCPYVVTVDPATDRQLSDTDRTLDYANLSTERQQEFDRALENGSVEMPTLPDAWSSPVLVHYEGERYYVVAAVC